MAQAALEVIATIMTVAGEMLALIAVGSAVFVVARLLLTRSSDRQSRVLNRVWETSVFAVVFGVVGLVAKVRVPDGELPRPIPFGFSDSTIGILLCLAILLLLCAILIPRSHTPINHEA